MNVIFAFVMVLALAFAIGSIFNSVIWPYLLRWPVTWVVAKLTRTDPHEQLADVLRAEAEERQARRQLWQSIKARLTTRTAK